MFNSSYDNLFTAESLMAQSIFSISFAAETPRLIGMTDLSYEIKDGLRQMKFIMPSAI
jgi:hypothetical protein